MHIFTGIIQDTLPDALTVHGLRQCIPGTQILPGPCETHHFYGRLFFHHGIVKADLLQCIILLKQVFIIHKIYEFMGTFQHIAQPESKHSAIPKGTLGNIFLCDFFRRFLPEHRYTAQIVRRLRYDIAVFFTGIRGFDSHEHKIRLRLSSAIAQCLQCLKIIRLHIRIHRADHDRFVFRYPQHILQISYGQYDRRKSISSAGFHTDPYILPQLTVNRRHLGFGSGDRYLCLRIYFPYLTAYPLHHGFQTTVCCMKYLDKLFGSYLIG